MICNSDEVHSFAFLLFSFRIFVGFIVLNELVERDNI